eukprot:COSAG01_NODE_1691_length_9480_cov_5.430231_2_plen_70_part_00
MNEEWSIDEWVSLKSKRRKATGDVHLRIDWDPTPPPMGTRTYARSVRLRSITRVACCCCAQLQDDCRSQ